MNRRGEQRASIYERVQGRSPRAGTPQPAERAVPLRHCWVISEGERWPALLLEWRRAASGWQGRVVRPVVDGGQWVVVEEWVPADVLAPT